MSAFRREILGILFGLFFPTLITWVYFVLLKEHPAPLQQGAYTVGKVIQFSFPLVWLILLRKQNFDWPPQAPRGLGLGAAFGLSVAVAMFVLYFTVLKPAGLFDGPADEIRRKISGMGITRVWQYALLGTFYALCHSFLEEYYWRWFVFRQLTLVTSKPAAVVVSSLGFMSHHVLVLATFFGWQSPATWLFSAGVAIGGAIWALLYDATRSLPATWIGHCLVDAAVFALGYDLARDQFA